MQEKTDAMNLIEELRLKTEESDLEQQLKTRFGGYTKQSVLDYLNILRKNQQTMSDTFKQNLQTLYNEKEVISKNNDALQQKMEKIAAEYQEMKSKYTALEELCSRQEIELVSLQQQVAPLAEDNKRLSEQTEVAKQEAAAAKEMLVYEKQEVKRQEDLVAQLSGELEERLDEIQFLKDTRSEDETAGLTAKINELTEFLASQTETMAKLNSERSSREQFVSALNETNETQKQKILELIKTLEAGQIQNEKLVHSNDTLSRQLQDEYDQNIALIKVKSDLVVERLVVQRKLDEANSRIAMLELENKRNARLQELAGLSESEDRSS